MGVTGTLHRREVLLAGASAALAASWPVSAKSSPALTFLALGDWGQRGSIVQRAVAAQMGLGYEARVHAAHLRDAHADT